MAETPLFSVGSLTRAIKQQVEDEFSPIRVRGEISNFRAAASGHYYFSLKDSEAQIRAVMFRGDNVGLRFQPADGIEVEALGTVSLYPERGDLQIIVRNLIPSGVGALMQAFEKLKRQLASEGLFDDDHKQELPEFPTTIAVVTSPRGAALKDFIHVLSSRWPAATIVLVPVSVQGKEAAPRIAKALDRISRWGGADVVLLGRGGGSLEDLWAFNEEVVARAIYDCETPIISAVGHESDFTIADFVADARGATPSAAAALAVPDRRELVLSFGQTENALGRAFRRDLDRRKDQVLGLSRTYGLRRPGDFLEKESQRLDFLADQLRKTGDITLRGKVTELSTLGKRLERVHPAAQLARSRDRLSLIPATLGRALENKLSLEHSRLRERKRTLQSLDPSQVLARGYSMTLHGEKVITSGDQLNPGDEIAIQFHKHRASAKVSEVHEKSLHPSEEDEA
ncbi:MAG: exodeoxyribonuclease VII large subunit [Candidatus Eisenbacteria bacterium]|uniref:Exodeoxyribonuclease 7 large subunit n=1 Tax=Eiseniibacteriota bacterium TaxID=2212470 RepID=A0A7Y2E634_UNCEI|nr:exodeoxyribonuclease VII large subunit [Candidatus Eisenbacteria bacterium]